MKTFTLLLSIAAMLCVSAVNAQYCMLPGRDIYTADQPGITNFKLNTINRTSGNVEKPLNEPSLVVTSDTTELARGKTYTVSITQSRDAVLFPNVKNNIRVWVDYNKNFKFTDAGETVVTIDEVVYGTNTATFTVPANAPLGITRLRATAKMGTGGGHITPTSCDTLPMDPAGYHGEMEDYHVKIVQFESNIEDLDKLQFAVYPNPATSEITVSLPEIRPSALRIELIDITGKLAATLLNEYRQSSADYQFNLDSHVKSQGVYFIKVSSGTDASYQKLVKTN